MTFCGEERKDCSFLIFFAVNNFHHVFESWSVPVPESRRAPSPAPDTLYWLQKLYHRLSGGTCNNLGHL